MEPTTRSPEFRGAYSVFKSWYHHIIARSPIPLRADMAKFKGDYATLYQREKPTLLGRLIPTHVKPFRVDGDVSLEGEVEAAVLRLKFHKAGGNTHLHAEHFKKWLREAYSTEGKSTPPPGRSGGRIWWISLSPCDITGIS